MYKVWSRNSKRKGRGGWIKVFGMGGSRNGVGVSDSELHGTWDVNRNVTH
jgi:hypothetical protein